MSTPLTTISFFLSIRGCTGEEEDRQGIHLKLGRAGCKAVTLHSTRSTAGFLVGRAGGTGVGEGGNRCRRRGPARLTHLALVVEGAAHNVGHGSAEGDDVVGPLCTTGAQAGGITFRERAALQARARSRKSMHWCAAGCRSPPSPERRLLTSLRRRAAASFSPECARRKVVQLGSAELA